MRLHEHTGPLQLQFSTEKKSSAVDFPFKQKESWHEHNII